MINISDKESRKIIEKDLHKNILVEASAGSGKTYMLVERLVNKTLQQ